MLDKQKPRSIINKNDEIRGCNHDKVRYGVIGLRMGRAHISGMREIMNAALTAVLRHKRGTFGGLSEELSGVAGYTDYKALLELDDVDAVVVAHVSFIAK